MEIKGYKAFKKAMFNSYGKKFEVGKTYYVEGPLSFGPTGNGYHFCKRLEDTLRYISSDEIIITEVTSLEDAIEGIDDYYGFYDMYVARKLRIDRVVPRKEIITNYLENIKEYYENNRIVRFIQLFKLTEEEKIRFKLRYLNNQEVYNAILYYQDNILDVYNRQYIKKKEKT